MDKLIYNRTAMRMNGILPNATACVNFTSMILKERSHTQEYILCVFFYIMCQNWQN